MDFQQSLQGGVVGGSGWDDNPMLHHEDFTPLTERIAKEKPELMDGLNKLRELMGGENFELLINSLHKLVKRDENMMMLMAPTLVHRSLIERDCIPMIKEAFGVKIVRVIA